MCTQMYAISNHAVVSVVSSPLPVMLPMTKRTLVGVSYLCLPTVSESRAPHACTTLDQTWSMRHGKFPVSGQPKCTPASRGAILNVNNPLSAPCIAGSLWTCIIPSTGSCNHMICKTRGPRSVFSGMKCLRPELPITQLSHDPTV